MSKAIEIIVAIIMLGIVITVHEFGHFLLAKVNGVVVKEFSLGMGPRLLSKVYKGTRYSLKLLPFGGSCLMLGEEDGSNEEGSFASKSVWQRISIVFAGPFFNFILAFVMSLIILLSIGYDPCYVYSVDDNVKEQTGLTENDTILSYNGHRIHLGRELSMYEVLDGIGDKPIEITFLHDGKKITKTYQPVHTAKYFLGIYYQISDSLTGNGPMVLSDIVADGAAAKAGLQAEDKFLAINDTEIATVDDFTSYIEKNPLNGEPLTIRYERAGKVSETKLTPLFEDSYGLGFAYNINGREKCGVMKSVQYGCIEVNYWIKSTVKSLGYMLRGKASRKDIGGPVRVVSEMTDVMDDSYHTDGLFYAFLNLLNWAILLSANLGVMNLLPIPALDGGRLLVYLIEIIRGKKMKPEHEAIINVIGFALLMLLMVFILFNDIINVVNK